MRPTKYSELPLHHAGGGGSHVNGGPSKMSKQNLQNAFNKGLGMAGIAATKGGSGDKERAYVIRQNSVMRCLLFVVILIVCTSIVLFSTILEISVAKRGMLKSAKHHHKIERHAHVKLMNVHLELQKALQMEAHEFSRVEEYRAIAEKNVGDHIEKTQAVLKNGNVSPELTKEVSVLQENLRTTSLQQINALVHRFEMQAKVARDRLKKVAGSIVTDVERERKEQEEFDNVMKGFGKDPKVEEQHLNDDDDEDDRAYGDEYRNDEEDIEKELDRFFAKLKSHKFPDVSPEVVSRWEKFHQDTIKTLDDEEKEVDMNVLHNQIFKMMAKDAPHIPEFNPANHDSPIDFLEVQIEEAKIFAHKQELLDLYDGWKTEKVISPYTVLSNLESLAENNDMFLLFEWLDGTDPEV